MLDVTKTQNETSMFGSSVAGAPPNLHHLLCRGRAGLEKHSGNHRGYGVGPSLDKVICSIGIATAYTGRRG